MKSIITIVKRVVKRIITPLKRARRRPRRQASPPVWLPPKEVLNQPVHIEAPAASREEWTRKLEKQEWQDEWEDKLRENGLLDAGDSLGTCRGCGQQAQTMPLRVPSRYAGEHDREKFHLEVLDLPSEDSDDMPPLTRVQRVPSETNWDSGSVQPTSSDEKDEVYSEHSSADDK